MISFSCPTTKTDPVPTLKYLETVIPISQLAKSIVIAPHEGTRELAHF